MYICIPVSRCNMYVYMYIYTYVYVCVYTYTYVIHIHTHTHTHTYIYMYSRVAVHRGMCLSLGLFCDYGRSLLRQC